MKIEISDTQALVIQKALDSYSRAKIGQIEYSLEHLWLDGNISRPSQSTIKEITDKLFPSTNGYHSINSEKTSDSARIAYDLLQSIRHHLWKSGNKKLMHIVDASPPMQTSTQPLPIIE